MSEDLNEDDPLLSFRSEAASPAEPVSETLPPAESKRSNTGARVSIPIDHAPPGDLRDHTGLVLTVSLAALLALVLAAVWREPAPAPPNDATAMPLAARQLITIGRLVSAPVALDLTGVGPQLQTLPLERAAPAAAAPWVATVYEVRPRRPVSEPVPPSEIPAATLDTLPAASVPALAAAPVPGVPAAVDRSTAARQAIQRTLDAYRHSYNQLDANAAALIWVGLDTKALQRAFSTLTSQDLSFERCDVSLSSETKARALCSGVLEYVRKIGSADAYQREMSWTIDLVEARGSWLIERVAAR